jgi:hypothetical protein
MNRDFVEMLSVLNAEGVEYLVVGAHALAAHGHPRATGDLDVWVRPSAGNAARVWKALARFGAPLRELRPADLEAPGLVFQIGVVPCRVDVLTSVDGVEFAAAWPRRLRAQLGEVEVAVLGRDDLIANKRAVGRPQDLADVAALERRPS